MPDWVLGFLAQEMTRLLLDSAKIATMNRMYIGQGEDCKGEKFTNIHVIRSTNTIDDVNNFPSTSTNTIYDVNNFPCTSTNTIYDVNNFPCTSTNTIDDVNNFPSTSTNTINDVNNFL